MAGSGDQVLVRAFLGETRRNVRVDSSGTVREAKAAILAAFSVEQPAENVFLTFEEASSGEHTAVARRAHQHSSLMRFGRDGSGSAVLAAGVVGAILTADPSDGLSPDSASIAGTALAVVSGVCGSPFRAAGRGGGSRAWGGL